MFQIVYVFAGLVCAITPINAEAYIGPGLGLGMAATVLGLLVVFILLMVGLIWLPIRRFLRERKQNQKMLKSASKAIP